MSGFEKIPEVCKFFEETSIVVDNLNIDEEKIFKDIQENMKHFHAMNMNPEGYLNKLAFISSILRAHNLQHISVIQSFQSSTLSNVEEKFTCTVIAESYNNDVIYYKPLMLQRFEALKTEFTEKSNDFDMSLFTTPKLRISSILQQKNNIKKLFKKVLAELNNDTDAALALTTFFIFEIENLSSQQTEHSLAFYDLFDRANPLDKWFAAYKIKGKYVKPIFSINQTKVMN